MDSIKREDISTIINAIRKDITVLVNCFQRTQAEEVLADHAVEEVVNALERLANTGLTNAQDLRVRPCRFTSFMCPDINDNLRREDKADGWP